MGYRPELLIGYHERATTMTKNLLGVIAAIVSIVAGIYLLQSQSASAETTVFDAMMHGMGAYFIARGLWMFQSLARGAIQ